MQKGFIGWLILLIIALALAKYFFDWSIFDAIESERGRATITYIRDVLNLIWSYLAVPFTFVWNKIIWPIFQALLEWGRSNASNA